MDLGITGKIAVVTGSTAGIGFAIASTLAAEGAHVVVNGRTTQRVNAALEKIRKSVPHATATGVADDLSSVADIQKLIREAGEADILVNNLGIL